MIHTVKGLSVVNEAELDIFHNSHFLYDPMNVGNLISGSSAFSSVQLVHLEIFHSCTVGASLEGF